VLECFPTRDHGDDPAFLRGTPVKRKCSVKNELWEWSRASSAEGFTRRLLSKQILTSMSQISCEHRGFAVPMRWRHAGGDLSRPNHANQRADHPSIRSTRRPRYPLHASRLPSAHPCRSPDASIAPTITAGAKIKSPQRSRHSRRETSRDFVPWRFLDAGRLSATRLSSLPASKNLVWGLGSQAENSRHAIFFPSTQFSNFFVRLESPFLRPDPQHPNAVARRGCQGWPSLKYLLMIRRCQATP